jgi:hypothetical protein
MSKLHFQILTSPLFICALALLLLNDFIFKSLFHNWLTGKLSDFAGLFVFPLFWTAIFPKQKLLTFVLTALGFILWKSPYSQELINLFNSYSPFFIGRVIDYTDLSALLVLLAAWYYEKSNQSKQELFSQDFVNRLSKATIAAISLFAFTATSYINERTVYLENDYVYSGSKEIFDQRLKGLEVVSVKGIDSEEKVFANFNVEVEKNSFVYRFLIKQRYCDSEAISVYATAVVYGNSVKFDYISLEFWCENATTEQTKREITNIFEETVVNKLGMFNAQKKIKQNSEQK